MARVSHAYSNARVRVRRRKLLEDEDYEKLVKMEVPQITRFLQDTQYEEEIDELGTRFDGATLMDYALSLNMANDFAMLLETAPRGTRERIAAYLKKFDVKNIKTLLRGKSYGAAGDEVREILVPAGDFGREVLYELESLETDELLEELSRTEYGPALEELEESYEEEAGIGSTVLSLTEDRLDKHYYENLVLSFGREEAGFMDIVRSEIDFANALTMLRLAADPLARQLPEEKLRSILISGGANIDEPTLGKLLEAPDLSSLIERLREEGPWDIPEELGTVKDIESYLNRLMLERAERKANSRPLSLAPVIVYMMEKENEVDRVRAIARGKEAGMTEEEIREDLL